jgi:glutamate-1-semialdehyde 2,1-aminomutase
MPFQYNRLDELDSIIQRCDGKLAAVVMEPIRSQEPDPAFVQGVRERVTQMGPFWLSTR